MKVSYTDLKVTPSNVALHVKPFLAKAVIGECTNIVWGAVFEQMAILVSTSQL